MHTTSLDIDRLCDLFNSKAKVSKSTGKVDLVSSHKPAFKVDDGAVLQLRSAFEETKAEALPTVIARPRRAVKKSEIENAALPSRNARPRRAATKDGAKSTATSKQAMMATYLSVPGSPRRSNRRGMNN